MWVIKSLATACELNGDCKIIDMPFDTVRMKAPSLLKSQAPCFHEETKRGSACGAIPSPYIHHKQPTTEVGWLVKLCVRVCGCLSVCVCV